MKEEKENIMRYIIYFSLFIYFFMIISCIVLLGFPYKTVDITNLKIINLEKSLSCGKMITVSFDYNKYTSVPADFSVELIPLVIDKNAMSLVYQLQSGKVNSPKGKHHTIKRLAAPEEIPMGNYKLRLTLVYEVNSLKKIARVYETENYVFIGKDVDKRKDCK